VNDMKMNLPLCDVPVKIANNSGQKVKIRIYYMTDRWIWFTISAGQPPFIWFMPQRPINIQYSSDLTTDDWKPNKVIPWKLGTDIIIGPPGSENLDTEVVTFLGKMNLNNYIPAFNQNFIDTEALYELHEDNLREMGIPIGFRKKIMKEIHKSGAERKKKHHEGKWDVFISHKQLNGADLAQAIKLQLELAHPELTIFLDVDDLNVIHGLEDNIKNTTNIILLITEGVLERPFVQKEILAAVANNKNIILVHDERNCGFPTGNGLPDQLKSVLSIKAIPYYREKVFRETCINQIWSKMIHE